MKLYDLLSNKETILAEAFAHPVMKVKPRAASPYPTIDDAIKATLNAIEFQVIGAVADKMRPVLEDVLLSQVLMDGEHKDTEHKSEWEAALDERVETAIGEFVPILSADWMGNHTIGSGLHLPDGVEKFVNSMGREVYKQLTFPLEKSPIKILAAAGVVRADLEARLETHNKPKEETMADQNEEINGVIAKIAKHVEKDFDVILVYEDLDLASDEDDTLALGAAPRLGLNADDVQVLQIERLSRGDDTAQFILDQLNAFFLSGPAPKAEATATKKTRAPRKPKVEVEDADAQAEAEAGAFSAESLQKLKEATTFSDVEMAQSLGVSRATFNNWRNGKSVCDLDAQQAATLRGDIVARINLLHEVLGEMDNREAEVVF